MAEATAPYNFISLPDKPLASEIDDVNNFQSHVENCERISGEIVLEIKTLTPIFLGGNSKTSKSFSPAGENKFIIPGSSLRGMLKNIFKIVTCGTFRGSTDSQKKGEDFNDEYIYFRCLMYSHGSPDWMKDLCDLYKGRMESDSGKNARPGFLIQTTDNEYFIAPSTYTYDRKADRILIKEFLETYGIKNDDIKQSQIIWIDDTAFIITGTQAWSKLHDKNSYAGLNDDAKKRAGKQFIRFTKISYVDLCRAHWRKIPDAVLTSYEHDRNRRGVNLLDKNNSGLLNREQLQKLWGDSLPDDVKTLIPCHYLEEKGIVTAFGHGQCFRIPYSKTIGDAVPKALKQLEIVDFADAVFGREKFWASRVFVEDAVRTWNTGTLNEAAAHPLLQPNPTSYQLYLKQDGGTLTHWDSVNALLRGYKLYWHNDSCRWQASKEEIELDKGKAEDKRLTKKMQPLKPENKFRSKIRFQNLSAVELGALLMIFDLNGLGEDAAYKIGMGKSLGLGSIKITPTLFVESANAYTELFDDGGFKNPYEEKSPEDYIQAFREYVSDKGMSETWEKVMEELKRILSWSSKPAPEKIRQMTSDFKKKNNPFLYRAVLPTIGKIVPKIIP